MDSKQDPINRYQADLSSGLIQPDDSQSRVVDELQLLHDELLKNRKRSSGLLFRLKQKYLPIKRKPVRGLYLWGGVGRGKTYLMDLFYECLPGHRKLRSHFHRFMRQVQEDLQFLQNHKNPLEQLALDIARQTDVICFDEFYVSDIADAMILGTLFEALFGRGVTLVATSNIDPDHLYERGLQRQRFLPAIALIKQFTKVMHIKEGQDYRLRNLQRDEIYHFPLGSNAEKCLADSFDRMIAGSHSQSDHVIQILGRPIITKKWAEGVAWFDFDELCGGPRNVSDYMELAQIFHTILISAIPVLSAANDDETRRFINLVDELYNHKVKLIVSAEESIESLYHGHNLKFAFERARSRMLEMRTLEYLSLPHNP